MNNYKTIEEMAAEWGITQRHIQNLCRKNMIEGAIKRAGAWFIPDGTHNPAKNTKSGDRPFVFVGTKKQIFNNAIMLFTQRGYENVSMNDITAAIGIRQSALYNHFKSKQELLDTIYGFFQYHYLSSRPSLDDVTAMLRAESLLNVIKKGFFYEFDAGIRPQMVDIAMLIIQRSTMDEAAAKLCRSLLHGEGINFIEDCLNIAVDIGRIAPADTRSISLLINSIRLQTLFLVLIHTPREFLERHMESEQILIRHVTRLVTDLKQIDE